MQSKVLVLTKIAIAVMTISFCIESSVASPWSTFQVEETETKEVSKDDPATSKDIEAVKKVIENLSNSIGDNDYQAAFKFMTPKQIDREQSEAVMMALSMSEHAEEMGDPSLGEGLQKILEAHELDELELPQFEHGPGDASEMKKLMGDFRKKVAAKLKDEPKHLIVQEINGLTSGVVFAMNPLGGEILEIETKANVASAKIKPELPDGMQGQMMGPKYMPVRFTRVENNWLYDGVDHEAMMKLMSEDNAGLGAMPLIDDLDIEGKTLEGKEVNLKDFQGKVLLVDFWGPWCQPCVAEFPKLKKLYEKMKGKNFEIISIAVSNEDELKTYFEDESEFPWPNIHDTDGISEDLGIRAFPTKLIVDADGNHIASPRGTAELLKTLSKTLKLSDEEFKELKSYLKKK